MVVRGGLMAPEGLWTNAEDHHLEKLDEGQEDQWAISVFSADELSIAEICEAGPIPHPKIRVSTVDAVRSLGFDVVPTDAVHADLKFPQQPDEDTWDALRGIFGEPQRNPRLEVEDAAD